MGFGLPAAIGVKVANPKAKVVDIDGDGSFQMNIQELEWVKRENLPITMMVMNNHALGMIRHLQRDYFEQVYAEWSCSGRICSTAERAEILFCRATPTIWAAPKISKQYTPTTAK